MIRKKLFAFKLEGYKYDFVSYFPSINMENMNTSFLIKRILNIVLPYVEFLSEEYFIVVYANNRRVEFDVDQEINKRLFDGERDELTKIISSLCQIYIDMYERE